MFGRRTHCELVTVGLADDYRPRSFQLRHGGRLIRRHECLEHAGAGGCPDTARADVVLDGDRNAEERGAAAVSARSIDVSSRLEGALAGHCRKCVQFIIESGDPLEIGLTDLDGGCLAACHGIAYLDGASCHQPIAFGTLNKPGLGRGFRGIAKGEVAWQRR